MRKTTNVLRHLCAIWQFGHRWYQQCYQRLSILGYQIGILFFLLSHWRTAFADGDDYSADAKPAVDATFGANSTFIHFIYLAEVVSIMLLFNKNKNPLILVSLPVLLIATKYFFNKIGMS